MGTSEVSPIGETVSPGAFVETPAESVSRPIGWTPATALVTRRRATRARKLGQATSDSFPGARPDSSALMEPTTSQTFPSLSFLLGHRFQESHLIREQPALDSLLKRLFLRLGASLFMDTLGLL
jgi:hypothetical protein